MEYEFFIDVKTTIWNRERHKIDANSYEEALKIITDVFTQDTDSDDTFIEQTPLYETEDITGDRELIYDNRTIDAISPNSELD